MLNESEKVIDFGQKGVCWFRVLHCHGCCATYSWYAHLMAARSAKLVAQSVVFWYCFSSWLQPFNQSIRFVCLSSTNILKDNEPMISCSRRGGSYKSSNFLPMRNTWALWCWVDTSQPASEPEVINNMQVYWTCLYICSHLFCIMFYPIRSQFQLNLNCVKRTTVWAPCCVAMEIWAAQFFVMLEVRRRKEFCNQTQPTFRDSSSAYQVCGSVFAEVKYFILRQTKHETRRYTRYEMCAVVCTCRQRREITLSATGMVESSWQIRLQNNFAFSARIYS